MAFSLILIATLTACWRAGPVRVPFPDDPRVLNGQWRLEVTGRELNALNEILELQMSSDGQHVALRNEERWRTFRVGTDGAWVETATPWPENVAGHFDQASGRYVTYSAAGADLRVTSYPLDGSPATETTGALPSDLDVGSAYSNAGSGRLFLGYTDQAGDHILAWWEVSDASMSGHITLGSGDPLAMWSSSNGRTLLALNAEAGTLYVVDTAFAAQPTPVEVNACVKPEAADVSEDGRWLFIAGCGGSYALVDLGSPGLPHRPLEMDPLSRPVFAVGSSELVWVGADRAVHAFDPTQALAERLHWLTGDEDLTDWSHARVRLDRNHGLLTLGSIWGTVKIRELPASLDFTELPPLPFDHAELELIATAPTRERTARYTFTGSFETPAERLEISGEVSGGGVHEYDPTRAAIGTASVPPPPVNGSARVSEPGTGQVRYELTFVEPSAIGTVFRGRLIDVSDSSGYPIELQRAP